MKTDGVEPAGMDLKVLPAVCILLATWLLLWLSQGVAGVCALAYQCPAPDVRLAPELLFGGLMLVPTVALILTARNGRSWAGCSFFRTLCLWGWRLLDWGLCCSRAGSPFRDRFGKASATPYEHPQCPRVPARCHGGYLALRRRSPDCARWTNRPVGDGRGWLAGFSWRDLCDG